MGSRIEYVPTKNSTTVKLDGAKVGEIKKVEGGYQYSTKHGTIKGEVLPTEAAVKCSLEDESE